MANASRSYSEGTPVASVSQHLVRVPNIQTKINLVLHWIRNDYQDSKMLVFVRTKQDATKLRQSLDAEFPGRAVEIHSNKGQNTRHAAMYKFRSGEALVLVITYVSARGDVPETEVASISRYHACQTTMFIALRTGRAERSGVALIVDPTDEVHLQRMLDHLPGENRPVAPRLGLLTFLRRLLGKPNPWPKQSTFRNAKRTPPTKAHFTRKRIGLRRRARKRRAPVEEELDRPYLEIVVTQPS